MKHQSFSRWLITLILLFSFGLSACGGGGDDAAVADPPPVEEAAAPTEAPAEAPAEEAAPEPTDSPAEEAAPADETEGAAANIAAAVDAYLSTIPDGFMSMSLDALNQQTSATDVYVIDVRTAGEYEGGHIPGAVSIPLRTLAADLSLIPADQPVVVYCASGHRAGMATSALRTLGYENVRAFSAGWKGWSAAGEEVSMEATEAGSFDVPEMDPALVEAVDGFLSGIPEGFLAVGSVDRLNEMMGATDVFLLDVRTQAEVDETGVIPGAVHINLRALGQNLDQIPTDVPVVAYCKSGFRAALAAGALQIAGFSNVQAFPPSFTGWLEAGVETPAEEPPVVSGEVAGDAVTTAVDAYLSTIPDGFLNVSLDAFNQQREVTDVTVIDVRTPGEYEAGHIPGAVSIPLRTLAQSLDAVPTDMPVIVYCASGHRAGMATSVLRSLGYENVRAFGGGWKAWSAAGGEVSMEATEAGSFEMPEIDTALVEAADAFLSNIPEGFYAIGAVDRLNEMMDATDVFLLDVRTQAEVDETGVIPGATHINLRALGQNLDQIPTDVPVVAYCKSGYRAALAAGALHMVGFENVRAFPPSFNGWLEAGEPVE